MTEWQRVTAVSRESVIDRLRAMSEVLPEGSFGRTALSWAADDMEKQIPAQAKYGGRAWRCPICNAVVRPMANHCSHCGKRLEWPQAGEMPIEEGESYKERLLKKFTEVR